MKILLSVVLIMCMLNVAAQSVVVDYYKDNTYSTKVPDKGLHFVTYIKDSTVRFVAIQEDSTIILNGFTAPMGRISVQKEDKIETRFRWIAVDQEGVTHDIKVIMSVDTHSNVIYSLFFKETFIIYHGHTDSCKWTLN